MKQEAVDDFDIEKTIKKCFRYTQDRMKERFRRYLVKQKTMKKT